MDIYSLIHKGKRFEHGAGLVEYAPITLLGICILVSLFQVIAMQDHNYLLVIGAVIVLVLSLIIYGIANDYRGGKDTENES